MNIWTPACSIVMAGLLAGCGGGSGGGASPPASSVPGVPANLTGNVGDRAISLGWAAPANDGGSALTGYEIVVTPSVPPTDVVVSGTRAVITNLANGTSYAVSVRARNAIGAGSPAPALPMTPRVLDPAGFREIDIAGDDSPSGIFDPALLSRANGDLWLAYSSVNYRMEGGHLVQDVGIRLARSTDGGASFVYRGTIAAPGPATVTDTDPGRSACGASTCTGRWVYETSWLIEDPGEPEASRRFKLFAHKYFLYPPGPTRTLYHLGSIVMWSASTPEGPWSAETSLLGWTLTPPELNPQRTVNALHADLAPCLVAAEGSAAVRGSAIDFVFACPYSSGGSNLQKIVMLRSDDHAANFEYVATLLTPQDAAPIGADYFSAPAFAGAHSTAPMLLVTPSFSGVYAGCIAIPFADPASGTLFRTGGLPMGILYSPPSPQRFGGACSYEPALGPGGILQSEGAAAATPAGTRFSIRQANSALQVP